MSVAIDTYKAIAEKLNRKDTDIVIVSGDKIVCHHDYEPLKPGEKYKISLGPQNFELNAILSFPGGQFIWAQCPTCKKMFVRILHG